MRKRLTLQQKTGTRDSYGQSINTWVDIATVWGEVETVGGVEALHGKQVNSAINHKVTVRYRTELAIPSTVDAWRFTYDSRILNIQAALFLDEKKRYVQLLCNEGLNDG